MSPADPMHIPKPVHITEAEVLEAFEGLDWEALVEDIETIYWVRQPRVLVAWPMHLHVHTQDCGRA